MHSVNYTYGAQSRVLMSRHVQTRDAGCQIHGEETENCIVSIRSETSPETSLNAQYDADSRDYFYNIF